MSVLHTLQLIENGRKKVDQSVHFLGCFPLDFDVLGSTILDDPENIKLAEIDKWYQKYKSKEILFVFINDQNHNRVGNSWILLIFLISQRELHYYSIGYQSILHNIHYKIIKPFLQITEMDSQKFEMKQFYFRDNDEMVQYLNELNT